MPQLRELIKIITAEHLRNDGLICCQNLTGVGALQNTFPAELNDHSGVIELPTSDVSNSAIAVGMSLSGRRVIYCVRFAGFLWYNAASLVNYAAKSKAMWNTPAPIFIRVMATEGSIGPVASGSHHSMIAHMPGIPVIAPMTPQEWHRAWDYFMVHDEPLLCSEHRTGYGIDYEMPDEIRDDAEIVVFAISSARLNAKKAIEKLGMPASLVHVVWLKPTQFTEESLTNLRETGLGIVIDNDHETCGMSEHIAYELMNKTGAKVYAMGLEDRTAGFAKEMDVTTPSPEQIIVKIQEIHSHY